MQLQYQLLYYFSQLSNTTQKILIRQAKDFAIAEKKAANRRAAQRQDKTKVYPEVYPDIRKGLAQ